VTAISLNCWSESDQKAIREQLVRILNSGPFHQSQRRQRFLEYLVNEALAGRGERLKAYNVALEVFDRPETFDPAIDPSCGSRPPGCAISFANITEATANAMPFTSTYRRAHTHRKSSFGTRMLRKLLARRDLRRMKSPQLFPPSPFFRSMI
jgi:hypothetical protein